MLLAHSDSSFFLLLLLLRFLLLVLLFIRVLHQLFPHSSSYSTSFDILSHSCSLSASPKRRRRRRINVSENVMIYMGCNGFRFQNSNSGGVEARIVDTLSFSCFLSASPKRRRRRRIPFSENVIICMGWYGFPFQN